MKSKFITFYLTITVICGFFIGNLVIMDIRAYITISEEQ